jgi:hypothetical protein
LKGSLLAASEPTRRSHLIGLLFLLLEADKNVLLVTLQIKFQAAIPKSWVAFATLSTASAAGLISIEAMFLGLLA